MNNLPFSEEQLTLFKVQLEERYTKVKSRLQEIENQELPGLYKGNEQGDSYGDDAKQDQIRSRLIAMAEKFRQDLVEIESALGRLENKTFGLDMGTGEPISFDRLMANPLAKRNIDPS